MRVNSAFTGFFTKRLVMKAGIFIVMLAIFFTAPSFTDPSDRSSVVKEVNIVIREIGHRLLLQAGDSTSRVLPVIEINGTFLLTFENKLDFNHDSLQLLSQGLLTKTKFPSGYTVTVHDCEKGDIVYGFQVNNTKADILPCIGRSQPRGCYTMEFLFPDLYENIEREKAGIGQRTRSKPAKLEPQEVNAKFDKLKPGASGYDVDQATNKFKSVKVDSHEANPKHEGLKTATFNYTLNNVVYAGMLVLLAAAFLIWRFRKNLRPVVQNQNHTVIKEPVSELPALGKLLFSVKGQRLLLGDEVISLTDKECKVLELLHRNFGQLIPRETLMQEVWINEGVITGRSLDMFVSKLRKKLSVDPELRITNVHGKGYKLEIAEGEFL